MPEIRALCWIEVEPETRPTSQEEREAAFDKALDRFREAVLPATEHGVTIYRAHRMASQESGWVKFDEWAPVEDV